MTEAEIAALVAQAVAAHDANTTWGEELLDNAETIAVILIALATAFGAVVRWMHRVDKRVQSLEEYRVNHDHQDGVMHKTLERENAHMLEELREFRTESSAQHKELWDSMTTAIKEGRDERGKLHEKVNRLSDAVARLIGFQEGREK